MKTFSDEAITVTRKEFFRKGHPYEIGLINKGSLSLGNFNYFILPQELEPRLPNFVLRMTNKPGRGYVLGVSDSVPEEFRIPALAHEYLEFVRGYGPEIKNPCRQALQDELQLVPSGRMRDYIEMRRDFFSTLVDYCNGMEEYTGEDVERFAGNARFLERLLKGDSASRVETELQ